MITQITEQKLSIQLGAAHRRVLGKFIDHEEVTTVLCFQSPLSGVPRLVPVGRGLEFESVEAAVAVFGSTASTVFSVDCRLKADSAVSTRQRDGNGNRVANTELLLLRAKLKQAEDRVKELEEVSELRRILDEHEQNLNAREESLMRMEDELMMRMHKYMEQMAELEQREETLVQREYDFERNSVSKLA